MGVAARHKGLLYELGDNNMFYPVKKTKFKVWDVDKYVPVFGFVLIKVYGAYYALSNKDSSLKEAVLIPNPFLRIHLGVYPQDLDKLFSKTPQRFSFTQITIHDNRIWYKDDPVCLIEDMRGRKDLSWVRCDRDIPDIKVKGRDYFSSSFLIMVKLLMGIRDIGLTSYNTIASILWLRHGQVVLPYVQYTKEILCPQFDVWVDRTFIQKLPKRPFVNLEDGSLLFIVDSDCLIQHNPNSGLCKRYKDLGSEYDEDDLITAIHYASTKGSSYDWFKNKLDELDKARYIEASTNRFNEIMAGDLGSPKDRLIKAFEGLEPKFILEVLAEYMGKLEGEGDVR